MRTGAEDQDDDQQDTQSSVSRPIQDVSGFDTALFTRRELRYHQAVQGHLGAPKLFLMFGVSVIIWKEKWQQSFDSRPGVTISLMVGILLVIGLGLLGPH